MERARWRARGNAVWGQRQRYLSLARAILANPKILILDDATSAIDADTEEAIHRSLVESVMHERTTVIIAHRQSTLRLATRVVVLTEGRVVAEGTNEDCLLESSDRLYRLLLRGPRSGCRGRERSTREAKTSELDPAASSQRRATTPMLARVASIEPAKSASRPCGARARAAAAVAARGIWAARAAFVAESPELAWRVAALPPLSGEPDVDCPRVDQGPDRLLGQEISGPIPGEPY